MTSREENASKLFLHYCFNKNHKKALKTYKAILSNDYSGIISSRVEYNLYDDLCLIRKNSKKRKIKKVERLNSARDKVKIVF